jgi:hypothetical protein
MGKTISCWITNDEKEALETLCKEYGVTPYEVLKTALVYVLTKKPFKKLSA